MPPLHFPLRWESTGDQWWYASPIDFAAANGHYDLVRELLHFDTNLLIKLTSLRRIQRLETVWDDEEQFENVAKCRSQVARKLLIESESKNSHGRHGRHSSLIRAGYGGWLLYTAASAGDVGFVKELLQRDPLLVFGEGEYGVTDMLYAAARSKKCEVFHVFLDFLIWSKGEEIGSVFKWEMMNRAVHAAARGGNLEILKQLLVDCCDVFMFRDVHGSTLLHTASGRGQTEVVKYLLESYDIVDSTDSQHNTALHIAAYNGHLQVVKILFSSSPASVASTNDSGDTFLHTTIAGFRTPGFRRVDRQIDFMKELVSGKTVNIDDIINVKNNDGRTALHVAVIENIHCDLLELLMTVGSIDLNIRDVDRMTPLDLLRQRPRSAASEILIKRLISAGGISNYHDYMTRTALASHLKTHSIGGSPGTSFRIPDGEIIFYTNVDNEHVSTEKYYKYSGELSQLDSPARSNSGTSAPSRLKLMFQSARKNRDACDSYNRAPLREMFSKGCILNNKRVLSPSLSMRKTFSEGLSHGVLQIDGFESPSSPWSGSSWSSPVSLDHSSVGNVNHTRSSSSPRTMKDAKPKFHRRQSSLSKILMNQVFCFGAQSLAVDEPLSGANRHQSNNRRVI